MFKTSDAGLDLIKAFEGVRLSAYQDSVGVWTIGYGSTWGVHPGMVISNAQADMMLRQAVVVFESTINAVVTQPINQSMFDAMVSFTYNVGPGNFKKSSVLRLVNTGELHAAADAFLLWNKAGGIAVQGLTNRRQMERAMFLRGVSQLAQAPAPMPDETPATSDQIPIPPAPPAVVAAPTETATTTDAADALTNLYNPGA